MNRQHHTVSRRAFQCSWSRGRCLDDVCRGSSGIGKQCYSFLPFSPAPRRGTSQPRMIWDRRLSRHAAARSVRALETRMTPVHDSQPRESSARTSAVAAAALAALVTGAATVGWLIGRSSLLLNPGNDAEVQPATALALIIGSALTLVVLLVAVI